jgi:hypothetical protein
MVIVMKTINFTQVGLLLTMGLLVFTGDLPLWGFGLFVVYHFAPSVVWILPWYRHRVQREYAQQMREWQLRQLAQVSAAQQHELTGGSHDN